MSNLFDWIDKGGKFIGILLGVVAVGNVFLQGNEIITFILVLTAWLLISIWLYGIWAIKEPHQAGLRNKTLNKPSPSRLQYLALASSIAISVLFLVWASRGIYQYLKYFNYSVTEIPEEKFGIILAEFTQGENHERFTGGVDIRDKLYEDIQRMIAQQELDEIVEVQKYKEVTSDQEARKVGEENNADIIVWGYIPSQSPESMKPSFTILTTIEDFETVDPVIFQVQVEGKNANSMLTSRVRAVTCFTLARVYLDSEERGDFRTAIKLLDQGIVEAKSEYDENPQLKNDLGYNLSLLYLARGRAYAALGDEEKALENYEQAKSYSSIHTRAYAAIGNIYLAKKNYEEAFNNFQRALPDWYGYYGLGQVEYEQGLYRQAADDFEDALEGALQTEISETGTAVTQIHFSLALSYAEMDMREQASPHFYVVCRSQKVPTNLSREACQTLQSYETAVATPSHIPNFFTPTPTRQPSLDSNIPTLQPFKLECSDGVDNDNDGRTDKGDADCKNSNDKSESH